MANVLKKPQNFSNGNHYRLRDESTSNVSQSSSRTMTLATNDLRTSAAASPQLHNAQHRVQPQPMSTTEQYWAARALRAEALLEAHDVHKKEVQTVGQEHDMKRQREVSILAQEYKEKHASLERLLLFLFILIGVLILVIIYLTLHFARHSLLIQYKQQERWWSAIGASHFTIPILSPFTSVVEQETSAFGGRLIGTLAAIAACLVYFAFRHWLAKQTNATTSASTTSLTKSATTTISRAII